MMSVAFATLIMALAVGAQAGQDQADDFQVSITPPARRAPDAPPAPPPTLPSAADQVVPSTLDVVTSSLDADGAERTSRQRIVRTRDRIHMQIAGREWLFERNPVDPRRVFGHMVDSKTKTIVAHEESDLRNRMGISGWASLLMVGFGEEQLSLLRRTDESRDIDGIRFVRYVATADTVSRPDVWWSEEHALASGFLTSDGVAPTRIDIAQVDRAIDAELLRRPSERFPTYAAKDLADWLEH